MPGLYESRLPGTRTDHRNGRRQVATRPFGIIHDSRGALIDDVTTRSVHCADGKLQVFAVPVH